jgi:hypothetical protein
LWFSKLQWSVLSLFLSQCCLSSDALTFVALSKQENAVLCFFDVFCAGQAGNKCSRLGYFYFTRSTAWVGPVVPVPSMNEQTCKPFLPVGSCFVLLVKLPGSEQKILARCQTCRMTNSRNARVCGGVVLSCHDIQL